MSALFDVLIADDSPPSHVIVEGGLYLVLTDFRHWMRVESAIFDRTIPDEQKTALFLFSFTPAIRAGQIRLEAGYPFPLEAGIDALQRFYLCGFDEKEIRTTGEKANRRIERSYDYKHDISLVYAAFLSTYGMDLTRVGDMHWWIFHALFDALPENTAIRALIHARTRTLDKKATAAQKQAKEALALPEHIRWCTPSGHRKGNFDSWAASILARKQNSKK